MLDYASRLRSHLVRFEKTVCGALIFALMLIVFWGVLERYVLRSGTGWTDETARYVCVWAVMIGASIGVVRGSHVGVEVFVRLLPASAQAIAERLAYIICGVFSLWVTIIGKDLAVKLFNAMQLTATLEIPIAYMYMAIPVGFALMTLHYVLQCLLAGRNEDPEGGPNDQKEIPL